MISVFSVDSPSCDCRDVVTETNRAANADRRFCSRSPASDALAIVVGSGISRLATYRCTPHSTSSTASASSTTTPPALARNGPTRGRRARHDYRVRHVSPFLTHPAPRTQVVEMREHRSFGAR